MDSASINGEVHVAQGLFKAPESGAGDFFSVLLEPQRVLHHLDCVMEADRRNEFRGFLIGATPGHQTTSHSGPAAPSIVYRNVRNLERIQCHSYQDVFIPLYSTI